MDSGNDVAYIAISVDSGNDVAYIAISVDSGNDVAYIAIFVDSGNDVAYIAISVDSGNDVAYIATRPRVRQFGVPSPLFFETLSPTLGQVMPLHIAYRGFLPRAPAARL